MNAPIANSNERNTNDAGKKLNSSNCIQTAKRVLCVVETPFQLVSLLATLMCCKRDKGACQDLLFYGQYKGAREQAERLRKSGLFQNICYFESGYEIDKHLTINLIKDAVLNSRSSSSEFFSRFSDLNGKEYDLLLCSSVTRLTLDAKRFCVLNGNTAFYDDGSGSHSGAVFMPLAFQDDILVYKNLSFGLKARIKGGLKRILRTVTRGRGSFSVKELWLFSPGESEMSRFKNVSICSIETPRDAHLLSSIVMPKFDPRLYSEARFIYMTLSDDIGKEMLNAERSVICNLRNSLPEKLYVKIHPRSSRKSFEGLDVELLPQDGNWEVLLLEHAIRPDVVLFGACSTTQATPKLLINLEAMVVLLYKILPLGPDFLEPATQFSNDLISCYNDHSRVFVPETLEELNAIILAFRNPCT